MECHLFNKASVICWQTVLEEPHLLQARALRFISACFIFSSLLAASDHLLSHAQDMIANMVSAHISIRTSGPEASAHTIEALARLYNLVIHAKPRTNITP